MTDNQQFLEKCRKLIEEKLGWGSSNQWQNQDFENLGDRIFEVTGVVLSASTLKRIWGKVQYNSKPNLSTLDALARFAGFANWRTFTASVISPQPEPAAPAPSSKKRRSFKIILLMLALAGAALLIGSIFVRQPRSPLTFDQLRFSSKPVTLGVPNTVIFEYDATHSNADSVFIQQSWDPKRKFSVDKNLHTYTSTYYMPGFYKAKLILNDSVVREHELIIESGGWMGAILREPVPVYVTDRLHTVPGQTGISQQDLNDLHIEQDKTAPIVTLANVSREPDISSRNFLLSLDLQNTYHGTPSPCLHTNIVVLGTDGYLLLPLGKPGCAGEFNMMLGELPVEGRTHDLSAFGVDFSKPVQLKCEVRERHIQITVNNKEAYAGRFEKDIGKIVGVQVNFFGTGFIRNFQLKATG
ncbi:hypothetical protein [Niabella drilacis]|uniref:PKD domain-containing protein n=1 Tax=Niabella drilacis (strain DSM 25811 / CCM 8410 / CCUG 62505 / LMG 26954 / E90) TaxID=1285928 RepID=A0A1G6NHM8_NIADE|nr:hypothetical protein [Niabella drilacis]SDC66826.1 hypothetical protein SAMN04487894_103264 [Niabella drilacis]